MLLKTSSDKQLLLHGTRKVVLHLCCFVAFAVAAFAVAVEYWGRIATHLLAFSAEPQQHQSNNNNNDHLARIFIWTVLEFIGSDFLG